MISIPIDAKICLHGAPVDLRNGFEGLSLAVYNSFGDHIEEDTYFVFLNSRRTRIKVLWWTSNNLAIWYARSRNGTFCPVGGLKRATVSHEEFQLLLRATPPKHLVNPHNIA